MDLVGIVSQFSFDGTGGYQLLPRGQVDLIPASDICYTSPVVQSNMSTTGFTLSWDTDLASAGTVEYGLTEDLGQVIEGASSTTDHSVDLTGLEPGTIYYARAISVLPEGGQALSPHSTLCHRLQFLWQHPCLFQWRGRRFCGHGRGSHVSGNGLERYRCCMDHFCAAHLGCRGIQLQRFKRWRMPLRPPPTMAFRSVGSMKVRMPMSACRTFLLLW